MNDRRSRFIEDDGTLRRPFEPAPPEATGPTKDEIEEAYRRGYEEGVHEAAETARLQHERDLTELGTTLRGLVELRDQIVEQYKSLMAEVALETASSIVRTRIEAGDPVAARALEEAIDALPPGEELEARIHPDDVESVRATLSDGIERKRVTLIEDATLSRGGCLVDAVCGRIDATLETAEKIVRAEAIADPEAP